MNEIKAIHLSPSVKFQDLQHAVTVANNIRKLIEDYWSAAKKKGKDHQHYLYIGISENNGKYGSFQTISTNKPGCPQREFISTDPRAFVEPHLHILLVSNHADSYSNRIIDYMNSRFGCRTYKMYCVNYYSHVKEYIDKQSKYHRISAHCDFDPDDYITHTNQPQVLIQDEMNEAKEISLDDFVVCENIPNPFDETDNMRENHLATLRDQWKRVKQLLHYSKNPNITNIAIDLLHDIETLGKRIRYNTLTYTEVRIQTTVCRIDMFDEILEKLEAEVPYYYEIDKAKVINTMEQEKVQMIAEDNLNCHKNTVPVINSQVLWENVNSILSKLSLMLNLMYYSFQQYSITTQCFHTG